MPDVSISNRNPPDPADQYPLREYAVALFVEQKKSPPQVVEVGQYPTGAVF